jgi:hypothetical protein
VEYENNDKKMESVFSSKIRAGKRRTYFFDVRATKGNDYFLTITESRKRFDDNGYDRHKIFLYKEDFNKFLKALTESLDYVKTELMPDFDFDAFSHEYDPAFVPDENQASTVPPVFEAPSSTEVKSNEVIETKEVEAPNATETTPITPASSGDNLSTEEVDKW